MGRVKTRLQPAIDEERALGLYRAMLQRIVATITASGLAEMDLWVSSNPSNEYFLTLCNKKDIYLQKGSDLGEKMEQAAREILQRQALDSLLIVGSDCPALDAHYLDAALAALAAGNDVVIGPAEDGGYVLVGLRRPLPVLFEGIEWGTERVLQQTLEQIRCSGLTHQLLPPLWDVDTPQDLERLAELQPPLGDY